jgi:general secretion pathway protein D
MNAQGGNWPRSALRTVTSDVAANSRIRKSSGPAALAIISLILCSCEETKSLGPLVHEQPSARSKSGAPTTAQSTSAPEVANAPARVLTEQPETVLGSGEFVAPVPAAGGAATQTPAGDITLNFVNADVREVLPRVLGDVLHLNYTIDPKVQATVTVQTSRPLRQQDVLPVLQEVLRASGLTLVASDGIYRLLASEDAARSGAVPITVGSSAAANATARPYNIQILPLKYVAATELEHTLEPFVPKSAVMQVDATRNLLILSGTGIDLSTITDMVKAFDVDWIAGMSYGIIPVQTASPKSIADQLTTIFGPKGTVPLPGMLSFAPLERMNAILVVSPQRAYVEQARLWIERLDRGESDNRPHIYEYHVQNSRAADLAKVLTGLFSSGQVSTVQPQTAPGTTTAQIGSGNYPGTSGGASMSGASSLTQGSGIGSSSLTGSQGGTSGGTSGGPTSGLGSSSLLQAQPSPGAGAASDQSGTGGGTPGSDATANGPPNGALSLPPVRIVADEKNNNIVIFAQPRDYRMIEQALEKLDIVPLQVLIEATIAEVTLGNDLQYGLQYFFHAHENQFIFGSTTTPVTAAIGSSIAGTFPGFNYILGSTNANVVLNLLSNITNVHVVSAPELLVLDHQTASLLVGNQVPIPTAQSQSTVTTGAPLVTTVQYIDTGVILKVSPRVNANGLITLDVGQEVSSVANASSTAATNSLGPTITQRRIESTITVQDGETVALGGLIQDSNSTTKEGLPGLSDVPVLGALFRSTDRNVARTELLVLLSPKVLHNASDARAATDELQSRLHSLERPDTQIP